MSEKRMCVVKNRSASHIVYKIPELNIRREFAPGEVKTISYEELGTLSFQNGGRALMEQFLQITDKEARNDLNMVTEPEYDYSTEKLIKIITEGSLDEFLDTLDFAPVGIIDLIKTLAIELPMNDMAKRRELKNKTGFDVTTALLNKEKDLEEDGMFRDTSVGQRRVNNNSATTTEATPQRRVQVSEETSPEAPKYKVVTPTNEK